RPRAEEVQAAADVREFVPPVVRRFSSPHSVTPRTHLLSNGRYVVMVTAAGSGYSRWRGLAITRWREDVTRDVGGTYVFLRDVGGGEGSSVGDEAGGVEPDTYHGAFSGERAETSQREGALTSPPAVTVSPGQRAEVRER